MKYFIGLDGGGTKTKCVLTDEHLNVISETQGGPSTFLLLGTEKVSETILNLILDVTSESKINLEAVKSIVLGTTGAGRRGDAEQMEKAFLNFAKVKGYKINKFTVDSDARIALEGAFSGKPGSILIAGTGSIMFGKDKNGFIHRVGGFGRYIGDEGGGYSIGSKGLTAVAKHMDGRGEFTSLTKMLADKYGIDNSPALITEVYKNNFDIASVTPLVISAAEHGDRICGNIIESESEELILHIRAMINLLKENKLKLSLIGSTIVTDNFYAQLFRDKVNNMFNNVDICETEYPPASGAAVMAKNIAE